MRVLSLQWTAVLALAGCLDGTPGEEVGRSAGALTPVTWTDVVGATAVGNDLTKTAPQTTWNAGAVSVESLTGDGYVEFSTDEDTTFKMAGLSLFDYLPGPVLFGDDVAAASDAVCLQRSKHHRRPAHTGARHRGRLPAAVGGRSSRLVVSIGCA